MKRYGEPKMVCVVAGDWPNIISVRDYREALINQKPHDADDFTYKDYVIPCETTAALVRCYEAFRKIGVHVHFQFSFKAPDGTCEAYISSGDSWSNGDEPNAALDFDFPAEKLLGAANKAIYALQEAMK